MPVGKGCELFGGYCEDADSLTDAEYATAEEKENGFHSDRKTDASVQEGCRGEQSMGLDELVGGELGAVLQSCALQLAEIADLAIQSAEFEIKLYGTAVKRQADGVLSAPEHTYPRRSSVQATKR
jgi:hypothetical protein